MAYNKDAHKPLEVKVDESVEQLKQELSFATSKVKQLLNGEGDALQNIPANKLLGEIPPEAIPLRPNSGLCIIDGELCLDPLHVKNVSERGQRISDNDIVLLYDASRGQIRKTTLKELYTQFINMHIPHAAGQPGELQIKGPTNFTSTSNLTYDPTHNKFKVATTLEVDSLKLNGSIRTNIVRAHGRYEVQQDDCTILVESHDEDAIITLPRPSNHEGRILNIKKITPKHNVIIKSLNGKIDNQAEITLSNNNSQISLQCDSSDWWLINNLCDTSDWWVVKKTEGL